MQPTTRLSEETLRTVDDLIEINIDSAKGYASAADATDHDHLERLFSNFASERNRFAEGLKAVIRDHGTAPQSDGSWQGKVHRWWMNVRDLITSGEHALYAEMERGEDKIKAAYEQASTETIGSPIHKLIVNQLDEITRAHDQVKRLRDAAK